MVYIKYSLIGVLWLMIRSLVVEMSGLNLGKKLHEKMARSMIFAGVPTFFNRVPIGRILSIFSGDLAEGTSYVG